MNQFFARVVELREEKYVKYDGKFTVASSAREFLEMTSREIEKESEGHLSNIHEKFSLPHEMNEWVLAREKKYRAAMRLLKKKNP